MPAFGEVFVGRSAELAELAAIADAAADGHGAIVLITGEAGSGKSALVSQLTTRTALPSRWSQCWEDEGQPPYWPWTQLLRAHLPDQGRHPSPLGVVLPELPTTTHTDRFALHEAVVDGLASGGPGLLVIEDAHLADAPSIALLMHLARRVARLPLLFVVTCRDTEVRSTPLGEVLGPLVRLATTQALGALPRQDVKALLMAVAGETSLVEEVYAKSGGNALFATELARLLAHGRLRDGIPVGLAAVVGQRLARFEPAAVQALEAAAVLGLSCSLQDLATVQGLAPAALLELLAGPRAARVLRTEPLHEVAFSHALVREVLLERLDAARRVDLHARCVQALEAMPDRERVGRLAAHAVEAMAVLGTGPAVAWSRAAARIALSGLGFQEAARHLGTVARLVDEAERAAALLELGTALHLAGDDGQALEALWRAVPLARGQGGLFVDVSLALAASTPLFAPAPDLVALLDEAQQRAPIGTPGGDAVASQRWVRVLTHGPRDEAAERWAEERVAAADDDTAAVAALAFQHLVLHRCDRVAERLAVARQEAVLADRLGDPDVAADAGIHLLLAGLELADRATVDEGLRRLEQAADSSPRPLRQLYVLTRRATVAVLDGRYAEAGQHLDAAEALASQADLPEFVPAIAVLRVCLAHESADTAPSEPVALLATMSQRTPLMFSAALLAWREQRAQGQHEAAALLLAHALDTRPRRPEDQLLNGLAGLALLAEVVAELGPPDLAAELLEVLSPYADRAAVVALAVVCLGPVARPLALLASSLGRAEDADRWFAQALQVAERLRSAPWTAQVHSDWARSLEPRDRARAATLHQQAAAIAGRLGMPRLLASQLPDIVLSRDGDRWSVTHGGVSFRLPTSKGLHYLADLLDHPGVDRHALDLVALVDGPAPDQGQPGPLLDQRAKSAYKTRIQDLRRLLDEADHAGDARRSQQLETELTALTKELARAVGLSGRDRPSGSAAEKGRLNVTRALRSAIARISDLHPVLGAHLDQSIRTGLVCRYEPVQAAVNSPVNASGVEAPASATYRSQP